MEIVSKKLKLSEPDLTVLVGHDETLFQYHSVIMASQSNYIDAMLASPLKESNTMIIRFPDIEKKEWLDMMACLDLCFDPLIMLRVEDILRIAPHYHKYDFPGGLARCDRTLEAIATKLDLDCSEREETIHLLIDIFVLSDKLDLRASYHKCTEIFQEVFETHHKVRQLNVEHLEKLAPMVAKLPNLLQHSFAQKEEVLSVLWPRFFISQMLIEEACNNLPRNSTRIKLLAHLKETRGRSMQVEE